ncbi:type II CAAX endopeptidase family protein [Pannus brasiliensis CCIBt3594]|uniref:Type II CAAX endopeptidase family protein n=1 Tax=Pannus brasiliensis CCIBt3594 TaxID=1427578 RepID=A0AAW9QFT2_9CHRO
MNKSIASYPVLARLILFLVFLLCLWLPIAGPVYLLFPNEPKIVSIVVLVTVYVEFLWLSNRWSRQVHGDRGLAAYGLVWRRKTGIECLNGLAIGLILPFVLFLVGSLFGWIAWQAPGMNVTRLILEGSLTALGVGFAEEILFRGWLLYEFGKDYRDPLPLWITSLIFALVHFIKPLAEVIRTFPQFPALVLLGMILAWAKRATGDRLGMSIGLHAGLIWSYYILDVGDLVSPTGRVPSWVTGIDNNPLAGLLGLGFLGVLALWIRRKAETKSGAN